MSTTNQLVIASDHAGFELKEFLIENFNTVEWIDLGPTSADRVDYPDYAALLAQAINQGRASAGVLVCGSGIGMSIAANKIAGIRAAHVESEAAARLSKQHNDANILCLGSRLTAPEYALSILQAWLSARFEGGRHAERITKITRLEELP